jgi:hypothetical protein
MKQIMLLSAIALASPLATADFQASFALNQAKYDVKYETVHYTGSGFYQTKKTAEVIDTSFGVDFYLNTVSTQNTPILEAGFLSKSAVFSFANWREKINSGPWYFNDGYTSGYRDDISVENAQYFSGQTVINNWIVGGSFIQHTEADLYKITGGYYFTDSAALKATIGKLKLHDAYKLGWEANPESKTQREIYYHQVITLSNTNAVSFTAGYANQGFGSYDIYADASYYFTPSISLKADFTKTNPHDNSEKSEKTSGLTGNYFITETLGFELAYSNTDDGYHDKYNSLDIGIKINL